MSFKSEAHRKKLQELVKAGKVSVQEYNRLHKLTIGKRIPARISPPKPKK